MGARLAFLKWPVIGLEMRCGFTNSTKPNCTASYPSACLLRRCTTTQGPAWSTVQGTAAPSSANTWVMPSLIPRMPFTAIRMILYTRSFHRVFAAKGLDLHVYPRRQIELHQRVHRIRRGLENIDEPLVRAHFELLARLLIHVRRAQNRPAVDRGGQRNRPRHVGAGALGRIHNLPRGLVQNAVVVRFQANSNAFSGWHRLLDDL